MKMCYLKLAFWYIFQIELLPNLIYFNIKEGDVQINEETLHKLFLSFFLEKLITTSI